MSPLRCRIFGHRPEMNWCRRCGKSLAPAKRNAGRRLRKTRVLPSAKTEEDPIIHQPGCSWETAPHCDCGADPDRTEGDQ